MTDDVIGKLRDAVAALDETTVGSLAEDMRRRSVVTLVRDLLREVDGPAADEGLRILRGDGGRRYVFDGSTPIAEVRRNGAGVSCPVCGKVSSSERVLRSHMRERHSRPAAEPLGGPVPASDAAHRLRLGAEPFGGSAPGVNGSHLPVPDDWPVKPITDSEPARIRATCGECGRSWDDGVSTSMTPTPAGRCPFEAFH